MVTIYLGTTVYENITYLHVLSSALSYFVINKLDRFHNYWHTSNPKHTEAANYLVSSINFTLMFGGGDLHIYAVRSQLSAVSNSSVARNAFVD